MMDLPVPEPAWPVGGGELGALIRGRDWSATALGPLAQWPASLRTLADLVIHSPLPMVLLWGKDLVQIYNDAYAALCGARHPAALGQPGRVTWPELPAFARPAQDDVLRGQARSFSRQRLVLERRGGLEEAWFDLSCSPAHGEGRIRGIVATLVEVTASVRAGRTPDAAPGRAGSGPGERAAQALQADQRIARALDAGAVAGTWYWDVAQDRFTADSRFARFFSLAPAALRRGVPLAEVVRAIHPDDQARVMRRIAHVLARGGPFGAEYRVRQADGGYRWVEAKGDVDRDEAGRALTFPGVITDIEQRKQRDLRQAALLRLGDHLRLVASADDAAGIASQIVGETLGVSQAAFGRINPVAATTRVVQDWRAHSGIPSLAGQHTFRNRGTYLVDLKRGDVVAVADVGTDPRTAAVWDTFRAAGVRALLNVPVMDGSGAVAVFMAQHTQPRAWTDDEIAFVRGVADRTWAEMTRLDAIQALRRLNRDLEKLAEDSAADRDRLWRLSSDVMLVARFDGPITAVNPAWGAILGWDERDLLDANLFDLVHPDDLGATRGATHGLEASGRLAPNLANRIRHRDGSYRWLSWNAGRSDGLIIAVGRDVTLERERAAALLDTEEKLRHSLKMEAVGQLTGGLAHDFNNLLASIGGSLDLLGLRLRGGKLDDLDRFVAIAHASVRRAAALTHRLLAFSRRQPLDARATDVGRLVADMLDLIRRTIGPAIDLEVAGADRLWTTLVDPNQLENALLNLCINARDAMPDGGRLRIGMENAVLDADSALRCELPAGDYVRLDVTDTGAGMAPEVAAKAFEPFFTTKPIGQGTGLGLSMIYGFARQSGGHVGFESAPGRGTAMHLYLPRHHGAADQGAVKAAAAPAAAAGVAVLLVDDEAPLRGLMAEALGQLGHRVTQAGDAAAALRAVDAGIPIDLLVTDIGLAGGMNGRQLAEAVRLQRPDLKVLFITGYAEARLVARGSFDPATQLMTKPFALDALARRVAQMSDAGAAGGPAAGDPAAGDPAPPPA